MKYFPGKVNERNRFGLGHQLRFQILSRSCLGRILEILSCSVCQIGLEVLECHSEPVWVHATLQETFPGLEISKLTIWSSLRSCARWWGRGSRDACRKSICFKDIVRDLLSLLLNRLNFLQSIFSTHKGNIFVCLKGQARHSVCY